MPRAFFVLVLLRMLGSYILDFNFQKRDPDPLKVRN